MRSLAKPPLLPEDRLKGPEAAMMATTPATPLHILMRAAKEDGFRLPSISDVRSHSPAYEPTDGGYDAVEGRRRGGGGGMGAVSAAGRWKGKARRRKSAAGGGQRRKAGGGAPSGRQSMPELEEGGWKPREVDPR